MGAGEPDVGDPELFPSGNFLGKNYLSGGELKHLDFDKKN